MAENPIQAEAVPEPRMPARQRLYAAVYGDGDIPTWFRKCVDDIEAEARTVPAAKDDLRAIEGILSVHVGTLRAGPITREIAEALSHAVPAANEGLNVERLAWAMGNHLPEPWADLDVVDRIVADYRSEYPHKLVAALSPSPESEPAHDHSGCSKGDHTCPACHPASPESEQPRG